MVDGRIQVFEINTNPMSLNAAKLSSAIKDIDCPDNAVGNISINIPRLMDKPGQSERGYKNYLRLRTVLTRLHLLKFEKPALTVLRKIKKLFAAG